jgi:hypothetical protein
MKKAVLILLLAGLAAATAEAQTCTPDPTLTQTGELISPAFNTPSDPSPNTVPACIGEPYSMTVSFNIPDTITVPGPGGQLITAPLDSIHINSSGAIVNLPSGLSYICNPPNCTFEKNTLGCLLIFGTPDANNTTGTVDLSINITAYSPAFFNFPVPLTLPQQLSDTLHYFLEVRSAGQCNVGVNTLNEEIVSIKNTPNPFSGQTIITVDAVKGGDFSFDVFDVLGQRVYADQVRLHPGLNNMTFDGGNQSNGIYYYVFSNADGRVSRMMVIQR